MQKNLLTQQDSKETYSADVRALIVVIWWLNKCQMIWILYGMHS